MSIIIALLVVEFIIKCLGSCPEDFCSSFNAGEGESVPIGEDEESGCICREFPGSYSFCYGRATCVSFPKGLNFTTETFWLKSSQILQIRPGDLDKIVHVTTLKLEGNYNLTTVKSGAFSQMSRLRNLSISHNSNLKVLEKGTFDGLINLERLYLIKNAFNQLSEITPFLTNLPKLTILELSENNFQKIGEQDFEGLKTLRELNLIECQIEDIHPRAFIPLTNLMSLRLGQNNFNSSTLARAIIETINKVSLKMLNLYSIGLRKTSSEELLLAVARTNISSLCLARNQFEVITSKTFPKMPTIEILDLREVLVLNITNDAFVGLPNLKTLLLSGNKLASVPEGVLLQQLTSLDLQKNSGDKLSSTYFSVFGPKFENMKNLQQLNLGFNVIHALYNSSFVGLENLKILGLKNATIFRIDNGTFSVLSNLMFLNLENNPFMKYHPSTIEDGVFNGLNNLHVLLLGGCNIKFLTPKALQGLPKLQHLGLEKNNLIILPNFGKLSNLRSIDLSDNGLQPWQKQIFDKNVNLEDVDVSDNKFTILSTAMVEDFTNLGKLDLSNNPFSCDCSLLSWNTPKIMNLTVNQNLFCAFPDASTTLTVKDFLQQDHDCQNLALIIPLSFLFFTLGVLIISLYYFRWHLRYWIFLTRLHLSRNHKIQPSCRGYTNYLYDAFVSYSNEDRNFVIRLVTMLENYPPYIKLCVYERDFEVGTIISENVLESVAKSRKTVLIISDSYAKSHWCRWESQIAEHHRLFFHNENGEYVDDSLILIRLGPVNENHMTPTLRYLLKTRIYLQWDVEEKKQKAFWEKLREVLAPSKEINENTYL